MAVPGGPPPGYPGGYAPQPRVRFDAIGEAWQLFTQQMGVWIGAMLVMAGSIIVLYALMLVVLFATAGMQPQNSPQQPSGGSILLMFGGMGVLGLGGWVLIHFLLGGMFKMALKQIRGEMISVGDVFSETGTLPTLLIASILCGLAYFAGALLCILPGYVVQGLLMLTMPIIVDQKIGATEAMTQSWNALKNDWLVATFFLILLSLAASLGAFACGIGIVFSAPLYFLTLAIVYRDYFLTGYQPGGYSAYPAYPGYPGGEQGGYTPPPPPPPPAG
jgi:hypothetical protein